MTEFKPTIAIIVAALKPELAIGYQGKMPWRLRKEIRYFKDVTSNTSDSTKINAVVMGRKTWDSIPPKFRPLPDRVNVVLSRSFENEVTEDNVIHANSIASSLKQLKELYSSKVERVFIIGGAEIYNELINDKNVSHLLLTEIQNTNKDKEIPVDTFLKFPLYTGDSQWTRSSKSELQKFVGDNITIEDDVVEGDFKYNFTLWNKK
ncbi:dihydrofolate reductase [Scheffersomyces xylosifermentans]|uniref:dihydrofolate reductase n=1 Tax=Scheffersomyces xylosifermentans TaxID=1304137 RepID=UPI00315C712B